jgi:hypothetical protein
MNYYTVQINSGNAPGPYTVYYNTIGAGNVCYVYPNGLIASGLTLSQLQLGVVVYSLSNDISSIYVYNENCKINQELLVSADKITYPCICITITNIITQEQEVLNFCYNYVKYNDRPQYQTIDGTILSWNLKGYWEIENYVINNTQFRSNYVTDIPDSNWFGFGGNANDYLLIAQQGDCIYPSPVLKLAKENPSCLGYSNGSITAVAIGGSGGWVYSLDGKIYLNTTGVFTELPGNQYTVYAKDLSEYVISETITLDNNLSSFFKIPYTISVQDSPTYGNMLYKNITINYDTSYIPIGETVTFDYSIIYNLIYYSPGVATFDTTIHYLTKNGNPININKTVSNPLIAVSPSNLGCIDFSQYNGSDEYISDTITLTNGDIFTSTIIYGIDTLTNGMVVNKGSCYTKAQVLVNALFENVILSCTCCSLDKNAANVSEPVQIYNI